MAPNPHSEVPLRPEPIEAKIIDGKKISEEIKIELREQIKEWMQQENVRAPQLTCILVGEDSASQVYVKNKMKAANDVGIKSETINLPKTISEDELIQIIERLNDDNSVDGILVQLPLPDHIDDKKICNIVSCEKDVDGFNSTNLGRLSQDLNTMVPCTPLGVQELLKKYDIETFGKTAVVVGRSAHVGKPIQSLLQSDGRHEISGMDCTTIMCHRFTPPEKLKKFCREADIIIVAVGKPNLIREDMIKPGACVIDVGITRIYDEETKKSKLVGDVDFENVKKVAGLITPVPGGVGPMTVCMLMKNTFTAAKRLAKLRKEKLIK
ncbi:hypothetical protein PVAND_012346 [Polypedilum vanderplanki]|uniref:methenyltetrahydrofolate cyclohydrolase n=1 Tax=Polypedilum vanderplanki TaxID=319348 RepID=A0A9J6CMF5_POLVA|nr:hypothetical protein PVAND_012346 [Polypedilum vanderplanki]